MNLPGRANTKVPLAGVEPLGASRWVFFTCFWVNSPLAALVVATKDLNCASALEQFKSFVASTKAAKGEFTQKQVKNTHREAPKGSTPASGTFVFARPGKFIWTYVKPYDQVLQADGDQLFIFDKDLNQVTVKKLGDALGSSPAAILFGSNDLEKNFTLSEAGSKEGLEWLKAVPKAKDTSFEQITIGLRNGLPESMKLKDAFAQMSILSFKKFS